MGLFEGAHFLQIIGIASSFGLPGLFFVVWLYDQRRLNTEREQYKSIISELMKNYKEDVDKVTNYYERNVELVEKYEKLSDELSGIIHLNTQVQTRLVESIKNNMFCPAIRQAGPGRD